MNDKTKPAMERAGGRAFQVEGRADAKTLRRLKACVFEKQKGQVVGVGGGGGYRKGSGGQSGQGQVRVEGHVTRWGFWSSCTRED